MEKIQIFVWESSVTIRLSASITLTLRRSCSDWLLDSRNGTVSRQATRRPTVTTIIGRWAQHIGLHLGSALILRSQMETAGTAIPLRLKVSRTKFVVAMRIGSKKSWRCGGSIINEFWFSTIIGDLPRNVCINTGAVCWLWV